MDNHEIQDLADRIKLFGFLFAVGAGILFTIDIIEAVCRILP